MLGLGLVAFLQFDTMSGNGHAMIDRVHLFVSGGSFAHR